MSTITREQVVEVAKTLPRDNKNPIVGKDACAYTDKDGNHCIAGEILVRLGVTVPAYRSRQNKAGIGILPGLNVSSAALNLLGRLQSECDASRHLLRHPNERWTWGQAIDKHIGD